MIDPAELGDTALALLVAAVAAGNPPRRLLAVPSDLPVKRLWPAAALAAVPLLALGLWSGAVLRSLAVSPPTANLSAGLVLVVVALAALVVPVRPLDVPECGVLVPLAFPLLLRPELALVALAAGAEHGAAVGAAVVVVPLAAVPLLAPLRARAPGADAVTGGLGRILAGAGVLVGIGLVLDGIFAL